MSEDAFAFDRLFDDEPTPPTNHTDDAPSGSDELRVDQARWPVPFDIARTKQAIHRSKRPPAHDQPGGGDPAEPDAPIDWCNIADEDREPAFAALADFLTWALPRWGFTSEQFPFGCWWRHPDIIEEMTAWWGLWQVYIRNPYAHPADPMAFNERTDAMKERLERRYRGRCRHEHTDTITPTPATPVGPNESDAT